MIKQSDDQKMWFFFEQDEPVACAIYETCTDHSQYLIIVEEPTEGGPDIRTSFYHKPLVAAAFGLHVDETGLVDYWLKEWDGYNVDIPQILLEWETGKYFVGFLEKNPDGTFSAKKPHTSRFVSRRDAIESLLSDKGIHERLHSILNAELPF